MATLETIFGSETKIQILRTLSATSKSYSAEDLEDATTKDISSIYKALEDLRDEGVVDVIKTDGRKKFYRLDGAGTHGMRVMRGENSFPKSIISLFFVERQRFELVDLPPRPLNILFNFRKKLIDEVEGLEEVVLFGSAARGDYSLNSDIDLYIVCEEAGVEVEDTIYDIAESYEHDFSLIVKSKEQYESDFSKPLSKLADSMLKDGYSVLFGQAEEFEKYIKQGEKV